MAAGNEGARDTMVRCQYRMPHEGESRMLETAVTGRIVSTAPSTGRFRDYAKGGFECVIPV